MSLSNEDIQEIVRLLDDMAATELHLRTRRFALSLRRDDVDGGWVQAMSTLSRPVLTPTPAPSPQPQPAATVPAPSPQPAAAGLVAVRTPIMGTFYRAPKPGAAPFVEVGTLVDEDTVVGIIETMKLMNSVHAGVRGRVAEICANNDEFAELGSVLMRIAPEEPE